MFFKAFARFSKPLAIDLGTANTLIYTPGEGIILNEPSIVTVEVCGETLVPCAFGKDAKLMIGKTPSKIRAIRPMKDGVIADFKIAEEMIRHFILSASKSNAFFRPTIVICVPSTSTSVERRSIQDAAESAGARIAFLIEEPMAAAVGANLPVSDARGSMVVDIGGGTTEVAVISLGGVVYGYSLRVGGDKMDESIINYVRREYNLLVGEATAERIKLTIGSAMHWHDSKDVKMAIKGRDLLNGIPKQITISQADIVDALSEYVQKIIEAIRVALEAVPPELSSDIVDQGIVLTGGGALLSNLDKAVSESTKLSVAVAEDPLDCVVKGTGIVLSDLKKYRHLVFRQD